MSSQQDPVRLTIHLETREAVDQEELYRLRQLLKQNLEEFPLELVPSQGDEAPQIEVGAKGVDPSLWGPIVVVMLPLVLPKLIEFLHDWTLRDQNRVIRFKADLKNRSVEGEYPYGMTPDEAKKHLEMIMGILKGEAKKK